ASSSFCKLIRIKNPICPSWKAMSSSGEHAGSFPMRIVHVVNSLAAAAGGGPRPFIDTPAVLAESSEFRLDLVSYDKGPFDFRWGDTPPQNIKIHLVPSGTRDNFCSA